MSKFCTWASYGNLVGQGPKIIRAGILAAFAFSFLGYVEKIKVGDATPEETEYIGNNLTGILNSETAKKNEIEAEKARQEAEKQRSGSTNIFSFLADIATPKVNYKSASDSQGYKAIAHSEHVKELNESSVKYSTGASGPEWLVNLYSFLKPLYVTNAIIEGLNIRNACGVAKHPLFTAGMFVVSVLSFGTANLGNKALTEMASKVAIDLTVGFAAGKAIDIALNKFLIPILAGKVVDAFTVGEDYGNAVMSGAAAGSSRNTAAGGGSLLNRQEALALYQHNKTLIAEHAAEERLARSPFDPTSRHTFLGSIISSIIPYHSQLATVSGFIPGITSIFGNAFRSILPSANAADDAGYEANMHTCKDWDMKEGIGVATDIFCNPIVGVSTKTLTKDPEEIIEKLRESGDLMTEEEAEKNDISDPLQAIKSDKMKDYKKYCVDRTDPFGVGDSDVAEGKNCIIKEGDENANHMIPYYAAFFTDVRVQDGMDSEIKSGGQSLGASQSLNERAIELAWEQNRGIEISDKQRAALKETKLDQYGHPYVQQGASCDAFVSMVVGTTVDPDFAKACCGVSNLVSYMESHPEKYEKLGTPSSLDDIKAGDIMALNGGGGADAHIYMAAQLPSGEMRAAQGSYGQYTGNIAKGLYLSDWRGSYVQYRWRG